MFLNQKVIFSDRIKWDIMEKRAGGERMEQMDSVVTRLSEIDAEAQRIVGQAAETKKKLESRKREQQKAFDQELEAKAKEMLESLKEKLEGDMQQELSRLRQESGQSQVWLEKQYENRHEALAEELFRKVIEVS